MDKISIVEQGESINGSLNRAKYIKSFQVKVFSKSEELAYLKQVVNNKSEYDDSSLFDKLFSTVDNSEDSNDCYLKSKYLYVTTKGILGYLGLRDSITGKLNRFEIEGLQKIIRDLCTTNERINVISLGAADSYKEIEVFKNIASDPMNRADDSLKKINYYPVDISPMLLQMGINNFSANEVFKELNVTSIVADFWDLANYFQDKSAKKRREELFGKGKRLFLLLGGTLGNYNEKDFLSQVFEFMEEEDELVLSVKLKNSPEDSDDRLLKNPEFLLAPLTYIPYYYGYGKYHKRFLEKNGQGVMISSGSGVEDSGDDNFISCVPNSNRIAPYIEVMRDRYKKKVRLAWNTKYNYTEIKKWLTFNGLHINNEIIQKSNKNQYIYVIFRMRKGNGLSDKEGEAFPVSEKMSINEVVFNKSFNVNIFSKSEELALLSHVNCTDEKVYKDEKAFFKLFNQYNDGKDEKSDYYLKNKYLYVTTNGIMNYLRLYEKQKETIKVFFDFEKSELKSIIQKYLNKEISIVSLGAAMSDKEIDVFKSIAQQSKKTFLNNVHYYAVDISPMLIQLGINNFSKEVSLRDFNVTSIVADFWDMAKYVRLGNESKRTSPYDSKHKENTDDVKKLLRKDFFTDRACMKLFIILGGTFGNYTEKEFLDQIVELMDEGDKLFISVKLQRDNYSPDKDYTNLPGNEGFLLEPLSFIPLYYGYSRYYRDYLITDSNANLDEGDDEMKYVSIVPQSCCTAPYIEIDGVKNATQKSKVRLCWSTRYNSVELKKWINKEYKLGGVDDEIYKLEYCKDLKNRDWFHEIDNGYAVMLLEKTKVSYREKVIDILKDYELNEDNQVIQAIIQLDMERKLDRFFFDKLKEKQNSGIEKKKIKEYIINNRK